MVTVKLFPLIKVMSRELLAASGDFEPLRTSWDARLFRLVAQDHNPFLATF